MAVTAQDIQKLYIAYFNRPADFHGLSFQLNAAAVTSLAQVAEGFANSGEFKQTYAGLSDGDYVDALYVNLFGRHAESGGKAFWVDLLARGIVTHASIAQELLKGAINQDRVTVDNKVAATEAFYAALNNQARIAFYSGDSANALAKQWLAGVTTTESLQAATSAAGLAALFEPVNSVNPAVLFSALPAAAVTLAGDFGTFRQADLSKAPTINHVEIPQTFHGAYLFTGVQNGFTLTQTTYSSALINIYLANDSGAADAVNLAYRSDDGIYCREPTMMSSKVETVNIHTVDTVLGGNGSRVAPNLSGATATTVTASGTLGVDLADSLVQSGLKLVDGSGLIGTGHLDGLRFIAGGLTSEATIKGSLTGGNTVDFSLAFKPVSYTGGANRDYVEFYYINRQSHLIALGDGANIVNGAAAHGHNTVSAGKDADIIRLGNGDNIVHAGAGDDQVTLGSGANLLSLGAGKDLFTVGAVNQMGTIYTTIVDAEAGDRIDTRAAFANPSGKLGAALAVDGGVYPALLNAAAAKGAGTLSWFQFGGDTFIVQDRDAGASFASGTDLVVKLAGVIDLSASTLENGASLLTLA